MLEISEREAKLESKINQMSIEIDSLKASRNYYKDQCENLMVSFANNVQKLIPSYRTQEEVEKLIESITSQQIEKKKRIKAKMKEMETNLNEKINELEKKVKNQEEIISKQLDNRTELIEKLMEYKKQINLAVAKQKEAEKTLQDVSNNQISISSQQVSNQDTNEEIRSLNDSHAIESKKLKTKIIKYAKQVEDLKKSLSMNQALHEGTNQELHENIKRLKQCEGTIDSMKFEIYNKDQIIKDASSLIQLATAESNSLQNEILRSKVMLDSWSVKMQEKDKQIDEMSFALAQSSEDVVNIKQLLKEKDEHIIKIEELNEEIKEKCVSFESMMNEKNMSTRLVIQELEKDKEDATKTNEINEKKIKELTIQNQKLHSDIQTEIRLRQTAEIAKDNALNNLKNAYSFLNNNEDSRRELNDGVLTLQKQINELQIETKQKSNTIQEMEKQIKSLQSQIQDQTHQHQVFKEDVLLIQEKYDAMKNHSILKEDSQKIISALESENKVLKTRLNDLHEKINAIQAENDNLNVTVNHQENTIHSLQNDIKYMLSQTKKLKEVKSSFTVNHHEACSDCIKKDLNIKQQNEKIGKLEKECTTLNNSVSSASHNIIEFLEHISDSMISNPILKDKIHVLKTKIESTSLISEQVLLLNELVAYISAIPESMYKTSVSSNKFDDIKFLRSSITHFQKRIDSLQEENKSQQNEIIRLQSQSFSSSFLQKLDNSSEKHSTVFQSGTPNRFASKLKSFNFEESEILYSDTLHDD